MNGKTGRVVAGVAVLMSLALLGAYFWARGEADARAERRAELRHAHASLRDAEGSAQRCESELATARRAHALLLEDLDQARTAEQDARESLDATPTPQLANDLHRAQSRRRSAEDEVTHRDNEIADLERRCAQALSDVERARETSAAAARYEAD